MTTITETTVFTRANTSIAWTLDSYDINDPYYTHINHTFNVVISDDQLIKTITREWTDKTLFISDRTYSNNSLSQAFYDLISTEGLTFSRTYSTTT